MRRSVDSERIWSEGLSAEGFRWTSGAGWIWVEVEVKQLKGAEALLINEMRRISRPASEHKSIVCSRWSIRTSACVVLNSLRDVNATAAPTTTTTERRSEFTLICLSDVSLGSEVRRVDTEEKYKHTRLGPDSHRTLLTSFSHRPSVSAQKHLEYRGSVVLMHTANISSETSESHFTWNWKTLKRQSKESEERTWSYKGLKCRVLYKCWEDV